MRMASSLLREDASDRIGEMAVWKLTEGNNTSRSHVSLVKLLKLAVGLSVERQVFYPGQDGTIKPTAGEVTFGPRRTLFLAELCRGGAKEESGVKISVSAVVKSVFKHMSIVAFNRATNFKAQNLVDHRFCCGILLSPLCSILNPPPSVPPRPTSKTSQRHSPRARRQTAPSSRVQISFQQQLPHFLATVELRQNKSSMSHHVPCCIVSSRLRLSLTTANCRGWMSTNIDRALMVAPAVYVTICCCCCFCCYSPPPSLLVVELAILVLCSLSTLPRCPPPNFPSMPTTLAP